MAKWIDVGPVSDFPPDQRQLLRVEKRSLVLFRVGEAWHVIENSCPHAGLPLDQGELNGCVLTCPYHGYTFNLQTGCNVNDPSDGGVQCYPVKLELDRVWIAME